MCIGSSNSENNNNFVINKEELILYEEWCIKNNIEFIFLENKPLSNIKESNIYFFIIKKMDNFLKR